MALAIVTSEQFAELPEVIQAEYVQQEGGTYKLKVDPVEGLRLANVDSMQTALQAERAAREKAEKFLKKYKGDDGNFYDPASVKNALAKMAEIDKWDPDEKLAEHKANFERQVNERAAQREEDIKKKLTTEIEARDTSIGTLKGQLVRQLVDNAAVNAINQHDGIADVLLPVVKDNLQVVTTEDGNLEVVVRGNEGRPRFSPFKEEPTNMTVEELVRELKNKDAFAGCFRGNDASGGGSNNNPRSTRTTTETNPFMKKTFNLTEQGRLKRTDPAKYKMLKEAAERSG